MLPSLESLAPNQLNYLQAVLAHSAALEGFRISDACFHVGGHKQDLGDSDLCWRVSDGAMPDSCGQRVNPNFERHVRTIRVSTQTQLINCVGGRAVRISILLVTFKQSQS
jgi:hypothetical protein